MEKKKEIPWTDRKVMYKDGDPDIFRKFTWLTWKNMTEGERAMWTELSSATRAPIPKETIEFERTVKAANEPKKKPLIPKDFEDEDVKEAFDDEKVLENAELEAARAELQERGIKFAYNSKLKTLQKKLADADNTE